MAPLLVPFDKPVVRGRLVRRYKRFFVDVELEAAPGEPVESAGRVVVAHTANTGAMTGLVEPGMPVLLTAHHHSKTRTIPWELEAVRAEHAAGAGWVSVNTGTANTFAANAIASGLVDELGTFTALRREVAPSPRHRSRFDIALDGAGPGAHPCFVEVKSVTLRDDALSSRALFPDAVTERGRKHLDALARLAKRGVRTAMLYVNKLPACATFAPARSIDPEYARALSRAARAGVEIYCVSCAVDERGLSWGGRVQVELA